VGSAVSNLDHLLQRFEFVYRHVVNGRKHVRRQKEIILRLESEGLSTVEAESLLEQFETTLKIFEELYATIKKELGAKPNK
jgi:hypothetical protein